MNITIIGASAGIGLLTVRQALERGHAVVALSNNTDPIPSHERLTKINGSATNKDDLKKAIRDTEAIIVTIGTKKKKGTTLFSDAAKALIETCKDLGLDVPVLIVTGFGAGESKNFLSFFMRTVINLFLKDQYRDKTHMEDLLTQSSLKWEIVRPGRLTDENVISRYRILPELRSGMVITKISRLAVADFLVNEAEKPRFLFQYPALTE